MKTSPKNENIITLPSGTQINVLDLIVPGKEFVSENGKERIEVTEVKYAGAPFDNIIIAITYTLIDVLSPPRVLTFQKFMKEYTPVFQLYEIWVGWYRATGEQYPAHKLGEAEGWCFAEACHSWFGKEGRLNDLNLFNPAQPGINGYSSLYDNEKDATKR